jgi:hypothetical protein
VLSTARVGLSATTLVDGRVLAAGGNDGHVDLASAEVYDPAAGTFTPTAGTLVTARRDHLALRLPLNNNVLIVGGMSGDAVALTAELFAPWNGTFTSTGSPSTARDGAAGSILKVESQLLVAGGSGQSTAELYGFPTLETDKPDYAPGDTVVITGSGWEPLETVSLLLQEVPRTHDERSLAAVADQDGNIRNEEFQLEEHDVGVTFYLTATGTAAQAQTTFTDDPPSCTTDAECNDDNPCTADTCKQNNKCDHSKITDQCCNNGNPRSNGTSCNDGLFCNGADNCSAGACTVHSGDPCTGGVECNNVCNEAADNCASPSTTSCTDTTPNDCKAAMCNGAGTCDQNAANQLATTMCNDGLFCNGTDRCDAGGGCTVHTGDPCTGGLECNNVCNEAADHVVYRHHPERLQGRDV